MLRRIADWIKPPAIVTTTALEALIATETARIAQKATTGYARMKAGTNHDLLFKEKGFLDALEISRWSAFALVLADLLVVAEGFLRPAAAGREDALEAALLAIGDRILAANPHPLRDGGDWTPEKAEIRERLALARLAPPVPAANVGHDTARGIYDSLPIHPKLRREDFEVTEGMVRFAHVAFREELERRADAPAIVAILPQSEP
jgi:hypothetical protein